MKPLVTYYQRLCDLIETGVKAVRTANVQAGIIEHDLSVLFRKAAASKNPITWAGADSTTLLSLLLQCLNDEATDQQWELGVETMITSAFGDLSSVREPEALDTFARLRRVCFMDKGELFMWGRKNVEREDGSAVIVLHVSDLRAFKSLIRSGGAKGSLEEGMIIQD